MLKSINLTSGKIKFNRGGTAMKILKDFSPETIVKGYGHIDIFNKFNFVVNNKIIANIINKGK